MIMTSRSARPILLVPFILLFCACDQVPASSRAAIFNWFNSGIGTKIGVTLNDEIAAKEKQALEAKRIEAEKFADFVHGEFLHEAFRAVLAREPFNEEEFNKYLNTLQQGGHYEGVYNGMVYSTEYRDRERGVTPISALKFFAELMTNLALDQKYDLALRRNLEEEIKPRVPLPPEKERAPAPTPSL